ncbi:hypothetical protein [Georgenia alba]|uniref:Uncharacterized protein n=1 Tax=Georgenia alba TaxID=2233858 RepID=A0ABW2Q4T1_9MICO
MTHHPSPIPHPDPAAFHGQAGPHLRWSLVIGLGALALARPLVRITGVADALPTPVVALGLTMLITLVWVAVVGIGRAPRPVLTLTLAGLAYAACSIALSAVLSPVMTGTLQGPLATPVAIVPMLATNAIWGAVAGVLALLVQRLRGTRP